VTSDPRRLRQALVESAAEHGPGLFGLVVDGGEVVFESSVGVADLRERRPIVGGDRFRIGSLTKTYVAALVLLLRADGVLDLGDTVQRWLPGMVPQADEITVELLLRMRSGLPDYVGPVFGSPPDLRVLERYWSPETLVRMALTGPDRRVPGLGYRYSNTDYVLLGLIVEQATGQRVEAQLWQRLFAPLHLDGTTFPTVDPFVRGPHARGYLRESAEDPYRECTVLSPSEAWTAGAIVSTPIDVASFFDALLGGSLLDSEDLAAMTDCREPLDERCSRGLGIVRYEFGAGVLAYGGHGGVPGFTTLALRSTAGRCVVLYQNGLDAHDVLTSRTPFIDAALAT